MIEPFQGELKAKQFLKYSDNLIMIFYFIYKLNCNCHKYTTVSFLSFLSPSPIKNTSS
jgi:hypothetical protein